MSHRHRPRRILLTGFAPFDGADLNPSWEAARALDGAHIAGHGVVARELPVEFGVARDRLHQALRETRPALVLCSGLAPGRRVVSLERVAINLDDARIPDNGGRQPIDVPVVSGGPAAYFATLPLKAMLAALRAAGLPAEVSHSAGTFVCNHVFYGLMHRLRHRGGIRGGFVHLPPTGDGRDGLPTHAHLVDALRICLQVAAGTNEDARFSAGAID